MFTPMLASPVKAVPSGPDYLCEPKFDGWRTLLISTPEGGNELFSRKGNAITQVPYITTALGNLPDGTTLDGELVYLAGAGKGQFKRTQEILKRDREHMPTPDDPPLTYVIFDLLELQGTNLRSEKLEDRQKLLGALLALVDKRHAHIIQQCPQLPCEDSTLEQLVSEGYEGVVCKRRDSYYTNGARNGDWLKCKPDTEIEVEVLGMYDPDAGSKYEGRAVGGFTFRTTHGDGTVFHGKCGTGMDDPMREDMLAHPENYIGSIAEVKHWGIGETGALRFPSLKRFRAFSDKDVAEAFNATPDDATTVEASPPTPPPTQDKSVLLDRLIDAEEERDQLRDEVKLLRARLNASVTRVQKGSRMRNYGAMKSSHKLLGAIADLERGSGEGYDKAMEGSGDPVRELAKAKEVAREKGWL